jgi:2-polyprenyl-3-methyl-5-hydroxy-6-metoxy-1,4-benzoquinol methylase
MAPHLFPDRQSRIFDVGCGQGGLLLELRRAGYVNAYGIDRSPEQVAIARERGRHGVAEGDFRSRVGQQTRFDTIIAIDVLEHIPRDLRLDTLQPFGTSLNHRGKLIARTPDAAIPFGGNYHYGDRTDEWSLTVRSLRQLDSSEPR